MLACRDRIDQIHANTNFAGVSRTQSTNVSRMAASFGFAPKRCLRNSSCVGITLSVSLASVLAQT